MLDLTGAVPARVVIAGGSLAGMACAIRLHQLGIDALVLDAAHFPRAKLCGEFLGPDAFGPLKRLGIWEAVRSRSYGPVESVEFADISGRSLTVAMAWIDAAHSYGLAIPREVLDTLLVQQGRQLGVMLAEGYRVLSPVAELEGGYRLLVRNPDGEQESLRAEYVVDATGRSGGLWLEGHKPERELLRDQVGIQCHARLPEPLSGKTLRMFFFPGGYGGLQPLSDYESGAQLVNICMLAPATVARKLPDGFDAVMAATFGRNPQAAALLRGAGQAGAFHTTAALNLSPQNARDDGLIRTGDAMLTVDPFTGTGMSLALETGIMAAECIAEGLKSGVPRLQIRQRYHKSYQKRLGRRLHALQWFRPFLYHPALRKLAWPAIQSSLPKLAGFFR